MTAKRVAEVFIVGAGPGDPELLTLKAHRLLSTAEVVVYDRLVSKEILDLAPAGAMRIYAGKAPGAHHLPQDEINALLVRLARTGRAVVRLKGGDPFVFGRGSEEAAYLAEAGIAVSVVPGITAAAGCAAAAGIPLSHRGVATGVRFVTGHCREGVPLDLNWRSLADPETTLVVYMGLANIEKMCRELIQAGLPAETPAVAISKGTTAAERRCQASLEVLPQAVRSAALVAPVLLIVGRVVEMAAQWRSLAGDDELADTWPLAVGGVGDD
jgi:uroporphyrin-III C-methyltransferase/precorrin-2 dehydrogenase/sirohydrochlorin ferrochelatase/uroporphyrin-III C-methyltransferase